MPDEAIQISRYPNRRFYDKSQSRHVTLSEIEQLVRDGQTIEVRDSKTGEDLTRQVLTQILLERHPDKMELFPATLLHGLLRANDLATEIWQAYVRQAMLALENVQRSVSPLGPPLPWLSALLPGLAPSPASSADSEAVRGRLKELEERIRKLESGSPVEARRDSESVGPEALDRLETRVRGLERRSRR